MNSVFHIVFIRFSSLGDLILNSSLPKLVKKTWGDRVQITLLTAEEFVPLMEQTPFIDNVVGLKREKGSKNLKNLRSVIKTLNNKQRIDLFVDLHGTLRAIFLRLFFPFIPRLVVDKRTIERSLLTFLKFDLLSIQNKQNNERPKKRGELLLIRNVLDFKYIFKLNQKIDYPISFCSASFLKYNWEQFIQKWDLKDLVIKEYLTIVPSASFTEKRWPASSFYKLIETLLIDPRFNKYKIILLAGKNDDFCKVFDRINEIYPSRFYNLQGKTSLIESSYLLKNSVICIGNDTGLPHIAESVGTRSLFIMGPTGEEFGFYPHLKESDFIGLDLWCRPCTTNGKGNCIRSERFCLNNISVEMVINKLTHLLGNNA